jgi:hypothetical protein
MEAAISPQKSINLNQTSVFASTSTSITKERSAVRQAGIEQSVHTEMVGGFEPLEKTRDFLTSKNVKTGPKEHSVPLTMDTEFPSRG